MVQASGVVHGVLCWCNQQLGVGQLVQGQGVGSLVQEGVPPSHLAQVLVTVGYT